MPDGNVWSAETDEPELADRTLYGKAQRSNMMESDMHVELRGSSSLAVDRSGGLLLCACLWVWSTVLCLCFVYSSCAASDFSRVCGRPGA